MTEQRANAFYAVRPELVIKAANLFDIRASILDGGARSLYNKAISLNSGKTKGRWGKHQEAVIKRFCDYTITTGTSLLLPWQELVEDSANYDGVEGISARTGNRPLATTQRVKVNTRSLIQARKTQSLEVDELASLCDLPLRFMAAIESGQWCEVASSTAKRISIALRVHPHEIFIYPEANKANEKSIEESTADSSGLRRFIGRLNSLPLRFVVGGFSSLLVFGLAVWLLFISRIYEPSLTDFTSTQWRVSVELMNQNIPIPKQTIDLWRNGGYLEFRDNGLIAFSWVDPHALVELLRPEASWEMNEDRMTLKLDKITYPFDIRENREVLVTLDSTRSFEMTLKIISI